MKFVEYSFSQPVTPTHHTTEMKSEPKQVDAEFDSSSPSTKKVGKNSVMYNSSPSARD